MEVPHPRVQAEAIPSIEGLTVVELRTLRDRCSAAIGRHAMADTTDSTPPELTGNDDAIGKDTSVEADSLGAFRFVPGTLAWRRRRILQKFPALGFRSVEDIDNANYYALVIAQAFYGERARALGVKFYSQDVRN